MHKIKLVILFMFIMTASMTACNPESKDMTRVLKASAEEITRSTESMEETTEILSTEDIGSTENVTTETETGNSNSDDKISWEEAETLLIEVLGTTDKRTGYSYSYSYMDTCEIYETSYFVFQWGLLVRDHMLTISQLFVSTDGKKIYEGMYNGDKNIVYTEKNYIE